MQTLDTVAALRSAVRGWRAAGETVAFVPTMGNLHAGHLSLIATARQRAQRVVSSVFVNPTQFGPNEDFSRYPRTPERDAAQLAEAGCDLLFLPSVDEVYPLGPAAAIGMSVPVLADVLCGAHRPGHFSGVATVVARLFNMVQPDVAVFGRKDLQQLQVIRHLVADLAFPIEVVGVSTARETDGLALSSRNQYLAPEERATAPKLHAALRRLLTDALSGRPAAEAEAAGRTELEQAGFVVDYLVLRRESQLTSPVVAPPQHADLVALGAARLGRTRLIDNLSRQELEASG